MKIFKKNYVGIDKTREDITDAPLAFLTPYEDNAAGKKRRDSVDNWLYSWYQRDEDKDKDKKEAIVVDNIPQSGFKVVDVAERWTTSNKMARIVDPNGYELEISIANLVDLMLYGLIDKGEIMTECVWGREGPNNRLIPVDSDLYKNALQEGQTLDPVVGDIVVGAHNKRYIYLGRQHMQWIARAGTLEAIPRDENTPSWQLHSRNRQTQVVPTHVATFTTPKPMHMYYYLADEDNAWGRSQLVSRVGKMKIVRIEGKADTEEFSTKLYTGERNKLYIVNKDSWANEEDFYNWQEDHADHTSLVRMVESPDSGSELTLEYVDSEEKRINDEYRSRWNR